MVRVSEVGSVGIQGEETMRLTCPATEIEVKDGGLLTIRQHCKCNSLHHLYMCLNILYSGIKDLVKTSIREVYSGVILHRVDAK